MPNYLQKALNLVRKTGDRVIVFDSANDAGEGFVLMSLDEYERLTLKNADVRNLTEEELLDKINRDIAIWKSEQSDTESFSDYSLNKTEDFFAPDDFDKQDAENTRTAPKKRWSIPEERRHSAVEVEDEIEEDRQYLEHITF